MNYFDYEPKSMLHVRETHVEQARLPVKDIHTYISFSAESANGVELVPQRQYQGTPEELLAVMDRKSIRSMVNLIGGALVSPDSRNCSFIIPNAQHNLTIRPEDKGPFFWWKTAPGVFVPVLFPPPFATVREPGSSANDFEYAMSLPFLSDEGLEVYKVHGQLGFCPSKETQCLAQHAESSLWTYAESFSRPRPNRFLAQECVR